MYTIVVLLLTTISIVNCLTILTNTETTVSVDINGTTTETITKPTTLSKPIAKHFSFKWNNIG